MSERERQVETMRAAGPGRSHTEPPSINETMERSRIWLITIGFALLAALLSTALPYLAYTFQVETHQIFKILGGAALFSVLFFHPTWVPYVLCFAFPFADWLPKAPIQFLNTTNLLVTCALFGALVMTVKRTIHPIVATPLNLPIAIFLLWMCLAWVNGAYLWPDRSWGGVDRVKAFWASVSGFSVFFVMTHLVTRRDQVWRLVGFLVLGSAIGILGPVREILDGGWGIRTGGGIGDINRMGAFLAMAAVFAISILPAFRGLARLGTIIAGAITTLGMFLPNSRGAYVGFLVAAIPQALRTGILGTILLATIVGSGVLWAPSFVKERITTTVDETSEEGETGEGLDKTSGGRLTIWQEALRVIEENPVIGVGFGNMKEATRLSAGLYKHVHNLYLEVAGEMGIPGLLLLLWLFVSAWRLGARLVPRGGRSAVLGRAYQGAIASLLVSNLFGQRLFDFGLSGFFFGLSGIVAIEERLTRETHTTEEAR